MKLWQIKLTLRFSHLVPSAAFEKGLPKTFPNPIPRFPKPIRKEHNGMTLGITPTKPPPLLQGTQQGVGEFAILSLSRHAESAQNALDESEELLEDILDDFALQLQTIVPVVGVEVLDISPPLKVGEMREWVHFAGQTNYPGSKFLGSVPMGNAITVNIPLLRDNYAYPNEKGRAAMRWFVKALAIPFEVDKFAFLWVALEIMCSNSQIKVSKPYVARCGHEIPNCPVCGNSLIREVNGPTLKKYLEEYCGVGTPDVNALWEARQMFHGSNKLISHSVADIPRLNLILRSAVLTSIKKELNLPLDQPPIFQPVATSISPYFAMHGEMHITEEDVVAAA